MIVKRDPDRFKKFYPDKRAVIPPDYGGTEIREYLIYSTVGVFKISSKGSSNEQKSSNKA